MGVVYRGLDPHLGRYVAIKVMSQGIATDQELRDRFLREARAAGSLQHPNIITIFDFGEAEGSLYIAMEYVEGSDLSQIIDRQDPLPLTGKIDIMVDVLHALDYAHHRGVVHRDVKPANIRVSVDGRAKLMDFGIARLEKSDLTKSGIMIGTPDYMAPEQITGGVISPATDVFAVGAVLYEFLTGRRTFHGETIHEVLYKVVSEQPPPLRDVAKGIPGSLQPILDKALAKDVAQRYASAGLMARELAAVRTALGGAVTVAVASRATPIRTARLPAHLGAGKRGWRRPAVWAGAGVLVLGAAALVFGGRFLRRAVPAPVAAPGQATAAPAARAADSVTTAAATPTAALARAGVGDGGPASTGDPAPGAEGAAPRRRAHRAGELRAPASCGAGRGAGARGPGARSGDGARPAGSRRLRARRAAGPAPRPAGRTIAAVATPACAGSQAAPSRPPTRRCRGPSPPRRKTRGPRSRS